MDIIASNLGKRFNMEWIFRGLDFHFLPGHHYAVTGPNGSGKSTLLQIISGALTHNEGSIEYKHNNVVVPNEKVYRKTALCAPYLELIEEMTLVEFFDFHGKMKGWMQELTGKDITGILGLEASRHKKIREFSSGMKQRVKLAQATFSDVPLVLLDEPLTNLDVDGVNLYRRLIAGYATGRMVIVSSNDPKEYEFCNAVIDIRKYK